MLSRDFKLHLYQNIKSYKHNVLHDLVAIVLILQGIFTSYITYGHTELP